MKIEILDKVGSFGVILEDKRFVTDHIDIDIGHDGVLMIGQRSSKTQNGCVRLPEYELTQGPNKVNFISSDGKSYFCGVIHRNGRFMSVENALDGLVVKLAVAYNDQAHELCRLKEEINTIKTKYGIDIIGG